MKTIPFTATDVQTDAAAAKSDLVVDPSRCEGAVLFHNNGRVMMFPAGRPPILCRSRAKELATAAALPPPGFDQLTHWDRAALRAPNRRS